MEGRTLGYKPDYGLRLMSTGVARDVDHYFYKFRLYSLTVIDHGQYSTMVELPWGGESYALSLDFNQAQLEQILLKAPKELASFLRTELSRDPSSPRTVDFDGEVTFAVRARRGQLQALERERFVPLVAQEILEP